MKPIWSTAVCSVSFYPYTLPLLDGGSGWVGTDQERERKVGEECHADEPNIRGD